MSMNSTNQAKITVSLRLDIDLHNTIKRIAKEDSRSVNQAIILLLKKAVQPDTKTAQPKPATRSTAPVYVREGDGNPFRQADTAPSFNLEYEMNNLLQHWEIQVTKYENNGETSYHVTADIPADFAFIVNDEEDFRKCVDTMRARNVGG